MMQNAMYDYANNKQSQHRFARRFIQCHYDPADWSKFADDESMTIIHIERWLDSINVDKIFVSRLHVLFPRDGSRDVMFVIEFACPHLIYLDELLKRWNCDSNFSSGIDNPECYKNMWTCGQDSFKLIVAPTY